jgi:hypothetical protein
MNSGSAILPNNASGRVKGYPTVCLQFYLVLTLSLLRSFINVKIVHEKHYIKSTTLTKKQNEGQLRVTIVFSVKKQWTSFNWRSHDRGEPGQKQLTLLKWYPEAREIWSCKSPLRASTGSMRMTWVSDESRWRSLRGPVGAAGIGGWTPFNSKVSNLGPPCAWRSSTLMRLLLVSATYSFPTDDAQQRSTPNVRSKLTLLKSY